MTAGAESKLLYLIMPICFAGRANIQLKWSGAIDTALVFIYE